MSHYTQKQRKKNVDAVINILKAHPSAERFKLQNLIAFNLGCTIKKAGEYIDLIQVLSDQSSEEPKRII